jgi:hypothetical protein
MIFKYLTVAAAAFLLPASSSAFNVSVERRAQDFSWNITSMDGYPTIDFDADSLGSEIEFKYNFTGTLGTNKYLEPKLFMADCKTPGTFGALTMLNSTARNELTLDVDVVQALIDPSSYYVKAPDELSANITFCVRVDYMYIPFGSAVSESVNFHETKVTVSVDLTAGFQLTSIKAERTSADEEAADAELDYPVIAYYCNQQNEELPVDPIFNQGDVMQVCIRIDDSLKGRTFSSRILSPSSFLSVVIPLWLPRLLLPSKTAKRTLSHSRSAVRMDAVKSSISSLPSSLMTFVRVIWR